MVHFFGVASLLLFLHIALVAADGVPPVPAARTNNIVTRLLGRASKCPSGNYTPCEDHGCCKAGYHCCNDGYDKCCPNGQTCGKINGQTWCLS